MKSFLKTILYLFLAMSVCVLLFFLFNYNKLAPTIIKEPGGLRISESKLKDIKDSTAKLDLDTSSIFLKMKMGDPFILVQIKLYNYKKEKEKSANTYEFEDIRLRGIEWSLSGTYYNDSLRSMSVLTGLDDVYESSTKEAIVQLISSKYGPYYRVCSGITDNVVNSTYYWFKGSLQIQLSSQDGYTTDDRYIFLEYSTLKDLSTYNILKTNDRFGVKEDGFFYYTEPYYNGIVKPAVDSILRMSATEL